MFAVSACEPALHLMRQSKPTERPAKCNAPQWPREGGLGTVGFD